VELTPAAALDVTVYRDQTVDDRFLDLSARVQQPRELHERTEADHVAADRDVVDRS
jgi:hypothetical protein